MSWEREREEEILGTCGAVDEDRSSPRCRSTWLCLQHRPPRLRRPRVWQRSQTQLPCKISSMIWANGSSATPSGATCSPAACKRCRKRAKPIESSRPFAVSSTRNSSDVAHTGTKDIAAAAVANPHQFHFELTSMSLQFLMQFTSTSRRRHFDVTSMSLLCHVRCTTSMALRCYFDVTFISPR